MKTLILYDRNTGDVISTLSPVDNDNYAVLVADVSETKQYIKKINKQVIAKEKEVKYRAFGSVLE